MPSKDSKQKLLWSADIKVVLWCLAPIAILFITVLILVKLWIGGTVFTTGIVDRQTIIPWSIGIGQIAFVLVAAVLAIAAPRHDQAAKNYRAVYSSTDVHLKRELMQPLNRLHSFTAALVGLNFYVGLSAMSLDPFWWVLIHDHVVLRRYALRDDYYYPEMPIWILTSLYLILVSIFLYLVISAGSEVQSLPQPEDS